MNGIITIAIDGHPGLPDDIQLGLREAFPEAEFHELISWRMSRGDEPRKSIALLIKTGDMPEYGWKVNIFGGASRCPLMMGDNSEVTIHSFHHHPGGSFWPWLKAQKGDV